MTETLATAGSYDQVADPQAVGAAPEDDRGRVVHLGRHTIELIPPESNIFPRADGEMAATSENIVAGPIAAADAARGTVDTVTPE
jgi:hypothetical protein